MDYGILSLLPPLIAVILAIKSKNVVLALFCGGLCGVLILNGFHPVESMKSLIGDYYFAQLMDGYNAGVLVLLVFIGGFIKLMERSGGTQAFAVTMNRWINTKRKAQIGAWLGGILIFFSDLGTPLLVGPIFRPIFDRLKISREKLAWVLDSTSSPVAIMVPFIGWGVYIMGLIQSEFEHLGVAESDYETFIQAIPFQIYAVLAILLIPVIACTKLDFSFMRRAEKRTESGQIFWDAEQEQKEEDAQMAGKGKTVMVLLPLIVLFLTLFGILAPLGFPFVKVDGNEFRVALTLGYFLAAVVLMVLLVVYKVKAFSEIFKDYKDGMKGMMDVAITLVLAWSLGSVISSLGTAGFIIGVMQESNFSPILIPAVLFLFGCLVSFSTGSSWGTFAILMPLAIPLAEAFLVPYAVCVGAVLSGGLFGDHCSPISDTTILSSTGAGCDLVEHTKTQLPYAVLNGAIAFVAFIIAGITHSAWSLLFAVVTLLVMVVVLNRFTGKGDDLTKSL